MLRPLSLALALALPVAAQYHYEPTNVMRRHTQNHLVDLLVINGKLHVVLLATGANRRLLFDMDYEGQPGRLDVELIPRSILALDSRPCARDGNSTLSFSYYPYFFMPASGTIWWSGAWPLPTGLRGEPKGGRTVETTHELSYAGPSWCYSSCLDGCAPELTALLCEVRPR